MNLDEYRALKAEMEKESKEGSNAENAQAEQSSAGATQTKQEKTKEVQNEVHEETKQEETKPNEEKSEPKVDKIEIDGEEFTLEEIKNGFMRQSDYTRKTQELSRRERQVQEAIEFIEQLQQKPEIAQLLSQELEMPNLDPIQIQFRELEDKYYDLLIEKQINELRAKYGEFDVQEVLETARDNNINDLDTAYHVVQSRKGGGGAQGLDIESLKAQLREELLNEIKSQQEAQADTATIIDTKGGSAPIKDNTPKVSQAELKVAKMMGLTPAEYAKWRDGRK